MLLYSTTTSFLVTNIADHISACLQHSLNKKQIKGKCFFSDCFSSSKEKGQLLVWTFKESIMHNCVLQLYTF